MICKTRNFA